jgi:hypothetical protein
MMSGDIAARNVEDRYLIGSRAGDEEPGAIRRRGESRGRERAWLRERSRLRLLGSKPSKAASQDCNVEIVNRDQGLWVWA